MTYRRDLDALHDKIARRVRERAAVDAEQRDAPHEMAHCARCRDNAEFVRGETGEWLSVCCNWPAIPGDVEFDDV